MANISATLKRGSTDLAILAVLADEPLHGYAISKRIGQQTNGVLSFTLASLYPTLYRLEKRGWLKANWETAASGRRRRLYRLTAAGKKQLAPLRRQWKTFFRALDRLAGVSHA